MPLEKGIPFRSLMATRQVKRLGQPATLTTYAVSGQDAEGDDQYTTTTYSLTVIPSVITNTREPFDRRGELGHYLNMHMEFFTTDTIPTANTAVGKTMNLEHEGLHYEVLEIEQSQIGITRLICYRQRV